MIEIDNKLVAKEIFTNQFVCNLTKCKGACCVKGDTGAPLKNEEIEIIQKDIENIKPFMRKEGIEAIEVNDVYYNDIDGVPITTLVNNKECAFVYFEENGTAKCAIEKAYKENKTSFYKPISCHLYPIRVKKLKYYDALNYDRWDICQPACSLGKELNTPVFKFVKDALIREYGTEFYSQLEIVYKEYIMKSSV